MNDPIRLKDEPQAATALREDLERIQRVAPQAYDASAGLSRLHSGIAAATASTGIKTAIWPWVTAVGLVSVTLIGYGVTRSEHTAPQPHAATSDRVIMPSAPQVLAPSDANTQEAHSMDELPAAPKAVVTHVVEHDPDTQLRLETAHLARARAAIDQAPAEALRLAQQGERRFAGGMFGQERQAIIVLTSLRLGHASAATAAQGFLQQYPHSPLADRIRDALVHPPESP